MTFSDYAIAGLFLVAFAMAAVGFHKSRKQSRSLPKLSMKSMPRPEPEAREMTWPDRPEPATIGVSVRVITFPMPDASMRDLFADDEPEDPETIYNDLRQSAMEMIQHINNEWKARLGQE